jgi:hypothetical protein
MDARRQAKDRVDLIRVAGVPRGQGRAEAERACRQEHVLHRRIDRRAGRAAWVLAVLEAGDDPHRRLVVMVRQVFDRRVLALVAGGVGARRRRARRVARPDRFVVQTLVVDLHLLLDLGALDHQEPPALGIAAARRPLGRLQDLVDHLVRHRVGLEPPHRPHRAHDLENVGRFRHGVLL